VLASGSILPSGTFWAGAAVAIAVVGIVVAVVLWALGSPRRLLVYNLDSDTAMFSSAARQRAGAAVEVTVGGQVVVDPHVVSFRVESRSRRDVRPDDFTDARPVVFEMTAPVVKLLDSNTGGEAMPVVPVAVDGSRLTVGPGLIKSKQSIKVDLLTDGPVTVTCPRPALVDVIVRQRPSMEDTAPQWLRPMRGLVFVCVVAGFAMLGAGKIFDSNRLENDGASVALLPMLGLFAAGLILVFMSAYRGGWMRGPGPADSEEPAPPPPR
jgi:hypothetical protein